MSQVQLTPQSEATIQNRVSRGLNQSADAVIDEALALLAKQEERKQALAGLRQAIQEGIDSGPPEPWDTEKIIKLAQSMRVGEE